MLNKEDIIEWISQIEGYKTIHKIRPSYTTFENLLSRGRKEGVDVNFIKNGLNELWLEDRIDIGDTINSKYIITKNE